MPSMITQKPWRLVTQMSDKPVYEDSQHKDFRGQLHTIVGASRLCTAPAQAVFTRLTAMSSSLKCST